MQTTMTEKEKKGLNGPRKYRRKVTSGLPEKKAKKTPSKKKLALTVINTPTVVATPPKPLVEYVYKKKRIPRTDEVVIERKIGVIFATVNDAGKVCIGFSVCHKTKDRFDYIRGTIHKPGFGLNMATERALRWTDRNYYEPLPGIFDPEFKDVVRIPMMVHVQLKEFIDRCIRYYKGREIPPWASAFVKDFNLIIASGK